MATLQQQIAEKFLNKLAESTEVSSEKLERLHAIAFYSFPRASIPTRCAASATD